MELRHGLIYDFYYDKSNADPIPRVYIIKSNTEVTEGLNLHYLTKFPSPENEFIPLSLQQWKIVENNLVERHKRFFEFINSDFGARNTTQAIFNVLKTKFPYAIDLCHRKYETNLIKSPKIVTLPYKLDNFTG